MKAFYKRFNLLLFIFLIAGVIPYVDFATNSESRTIGAIIGAAATYILLMILVFGFISLAVGAIWDILGKKKKDKNITSFAKKMIIDGLIKCIIAIILLFILSLALSFFSLQLENSHIPG